MEPSCETQNPQEQFPTQFKDLPIDVARLIVRTAVAQESNFITTSKALTLVSKTIQTWVDPLLFRHLEFHSENIVNTYIDCINGASLSDRLRSIRTFVWSMCFVCAIEEAPHFRRFLAHHSSLRSIYLCHNMPPLASEPTSTALPEITHLSAAFDAIEAFVATLLCHVTHLDISNFDLLEKRLPDLSNMPRLQVVAVGGTEAGYAAFWDALSVLPANLKTIIWYVNLYSIATLLDLDPAAKNIVIGETDSRIVVCLREANDNNVEIISHIIVGNLTDQSFSFFNWRCEGTTLWERAEMVKRTRVERRKVTSPEN